MTFQRSAPGSKYQNGGERGAHHIFPPVSTSYICADLLLPVARYRPSDENRTQHTTLQENQPPHHRSRTQHARATHLSCARICTSRTSNDPPASGLAMAYQSAPFFRCSGGTAAMSRVSGNSRMGRLRSPVVQLEGLVQLVLPTMHHDAGR